MWEGQIRLSVIVLVIFLAACVNTTRPGRQAVSESDWHEYVVYRIDDHRYISIRSPQICNGHLDGNIYYNDTQSGVRTFVSFTGPMRNGLYRGYYAIRSESDYIAIPALSFSRTSGMFMRIYYSSNGGRTFNWFSTGQDDLDAALILDGKLLYRTRVNIRNSGDYDNDGASVYDVSKNMGDDFAHHDPSATVEKYGWRVSRSQIPFGVRSPSGENHWACPGYPGK
ncbi:conserved hypothetical protein [Burkholderia ambifaria MEX-5]|uniref:Tli3-like domain-containing protein n=2 Tax=Burkholderia ambifaria TaxID=152480 RepID=B1T688_9BURK|nr:conserved hypothetical protein [Burkholderia ambifaria MEX-5]